MKYIQYDPAEFDKITVGPNTDKQEIENLRARIVELERDFHKQCELTARTMTRVADAEGEAAMLSILLERREEALMQVDKMCDAFPGLLAIQNIVRAALNGEKK